MPKIVWFSSNCVKQKRFPEKEILTISVASTRVPTILTRISSSGWITTSWRTNICKRHDRSYQSHSSGELTYLYEYFDTIHSKLSAYVVTAFIQFIQPCRCSCYETYSFPLLSSPLQVVYPSPNPLSTFFFPLIFHIRALLNFYSSESLLVLKASVTLALQITKSLPLPM